MSPGLVLEQAGESRREERAFLADVLPDRGLDVPAPKCVGWVLVGSHPVSSFVEMKVALSREEESHCTFQGGNTSERPMPACRRGPSSGSDSLLARTVRLVGASRPALLRLPTRILAGGKGD